MIYNEIKNPLRIYDSLQKQDQHYKSNGRVFKFDLLSPNDSPLPFQFKVPMPEGTGDPVISLWHFRYYHGGAAIPYNLNSVIDEYLEITPTLSGEAYITYKAEPMTVAGNTLDIQEGEYYMHYVVDGMNYYSEVFKVCKSFSINDPNPPYTRFEYDNLGDDGMGDLGEIMYQTGYKNIFFLNTDILSEEPSVEEEGHEDGAKNFIPDFSRYVENYLIEEIMPHYLADAMLVMSIHKNVKITMPKNVYSGKIRNMKATMKQESAPNAYRLSFRFSQDSRYINTACKSLIELFTGSNAVVTVAHGFSQGNINGTISFDWALTGNASGVRIKHISKTSPIGSLEPDKVVNLPELTTTINGFPNGTSQIDIIPITIFRGVEYQGTPFRVQVFVTGSAQT